MALSSHTNWFQAWSVGMRTAMLSRKVIACKIVPLSLLLNTPRACTSMAVSCGNPSSCGVKHTGERPPTVASEPNHRSLRAEGSSSSIIDPHFHNRHHPRGLTSSSVSPCSSTALLDGGSGSASPSPSVSLCSSPSGLPSSSCVYSSSSSSEEEELLDKPRRWRVPSSIMPSASWGMRGTKFANAATDLSSAQLRSLATPWVGIHSASSLAGLYARMLPLKMRAHTTHK